MYKGIIFNNDFGYGRGEKMIKKIFFIVILFFDLVCMEGQKNNFHEPVLYITEVTNSSLSDIILSQNNKAISFIRSGQKLILNKEMHCTASENNGGLFWRHLIPLYISLSGANEALAKIEFNLLVRENMTKLTGIAALKYKASLDQWTVLDANMINCPFNPAEDLYCVALQIHMTGDELQDSTLDVFHLLQHKSND